MEIIWEFIMELFLEGSIEIAKSKKVPKWIRYPLMLIIALIFLAVFGGIIFLGVLSLKKNVAGGLFVIGVGVLLTALALRKFITFVHEFKKETRN